MVPLDRALGSSYRLPIVTMSISAAVLDEICDFGRMKDDILDNISCFATSQVSWMHCFIAVKDFINVIGFVIVV